METRWVMQGRHRYPSFSKQLGLDFCAVLISAYWLLHFFPFQIISPMQCWPRDWRRATKLAVRLVSRFFALIPSWFLLTPLHFRNIFHFQLFQSLGKLRSVIMGMKYSITSKGHKVLFYEALKRGLPLQQITEAGTTNHGRKRWVVRVLVRNWDDRLRSRRVEVG